MAWNKYRLGLALLLVVTGSINTLSTKWADTMEAESSDGEVRKFVHPFLQALSMFLGEILCLIAFKLLYYIFRNKGNGLEDTHILTKGNRQFNPFILMIPAMCDMVGTSVMYIGLNMTYASSFQMFRGSVIIFVGLLSISFLGRRLKILEWGGMVLVIIGLVVVGLSDFLNGGNGDESHNSNDVITGDMLIIAAQVISAIQMVVEEKFVAGLDIPALQAVGWEGLFGFVVLAILQIPFYFIYVGPVFGKNPREVLEDVLDGFVQMGNNNLLIVATMGTIISIAFFNFAGISVTKEISATTRMVLDSVRTLVIWLCSMAFMGQKFEWLQLVGFIVLLYGMFLYNGITLMGPCIKCWLKTRNRNYGNVQEETVVEHHIADQENTTTTQTAVEP